MVLVCFQAGGLLDVMFVDEALASYRCCSISDTAIISFIYLVDSKSSDFMHDNAPPDTSNHTKNGRMTWKWKL